MALDMEMNINQYQKVLMTPQLEYSLKILKLNNEELIELIEEEVLTNPLLEYIEVKPPTRQEITYFDTTKIYSKKSDDEDESDFIDSIPDMLSLKPSLSQHLLLQLHTLKISKEMTRICEYLIENIDKNGYLDVDVQDIAHILNATPIEINKGIDIIHSFDPPGIGAKNLKECLKLQLEINNVRDAYLYKLIDEHIESIASNKIPQIALTMGIEVAHLNKLISEIRKLEPRPGSGFSSDLTRYVKPDIIVVKNDSIFEIIVNKETIPFVQIDSYYSSLLSKKYSLVNEEYNYINKNYHSAAWLIRCIEQRMQTIERVSKAIVESQIDFFNFGKPHLKPLTLKEIAYELELHESTISRAVNGKYLLCQWGVFELKYFFSSKLINKEIGEDASSSAAKFELKRLIEEEDKKNPLSDTAICEGLKEKSIYISRRTVAKYRAQLNIPSMDLRKKF